MHDGLRSTGTSLIPTKLQYAQNTAVCRTFVASGCQTARSHTKMQFDASKAQRKKR